MRTQAFRDAGGYDERFSHNEDAEFDYRLIAQGGRILLAGDILIDYYPRAAALGLWRQYYMFGRGRAKTVIKHRMNLKPRHPRARRRLLHRLHCGGPLALYLALCLALGVLAGMRAGSACGLLAGLPAAIMHLAWSFGFWRQILLGRAAGELKSPQRQHDDAPVER